MKTEPGTGALLDITAHSAKSTTGRRPALPRGVRKPVILLLSLCLGSTVPARLGAQTVQAPGPAPVGTVSELMVKIIYPASDAIFYISTRTPASEVEWNEFQGKALMVAESANLLMMPGHKRDDDRWIADARLMRDAGAAAFKAAKAKNVDALVELNDALYQSCVTCHQHYRPNYGRR